MPGVELQLRAMAEADEDWPEPGVWRDRPEPLAMLEFEGRSRRPGLPGREATAPVFAWLVPSQPSAEPAERA